MRRCSSVRRCAVRPAYNCSRYSVCRKTKRVPWSESAMRSMKPSRSARSRQTRSTSAAEWSAATTATTVGSKRAPVTAAASRMLRSTSGQPCQLTLDRAAQVGRNRGRRRAVVVPQAEQVGGEQRVALASFVQRGRQRGQPACRQRRPLRGDELLDLRARPQPRLDAGGAARQLQLGAQLGDTTRAVIQRLAAASGQQHQRRRALAAREGIDRIERRCVAPVQVFDRDHQRLLGCQPLDRIAPLAQHALARDAGGARQQQRLLGRLDGRRQLRQPARRRAPQQRQHRRAPVAVGEPAGGLQQGHVRLARAVLFDALPARDRDVAARRDAREEGGEQRRLADARLTDDEHHLALARQHAQQRGVERGEFARAPDRGVGGGSSDGRDAPAGSADQGTRSR